MNVFVTKANGSKQLFDREKVVRTCLRMGVTRDMAEETADKVEKKIYDGIETSKILQMIFRLLSKQKPVVRQLVDLRKALSLLSPKPNFERFIQILLSEHGYEVTPNQIVRGKCVEHEVDAIARKNGVTYMVEVKHHFDYHSFTGLDESRIARAMMEDISEGTELGLNNLKIDKAMIVCNTKFSEHAERYARCRGIRQIGWSSPLTRNLQTLIEEKKVFPVTYLKGLKTAIREKLSLAGIVLLKQLTEKSPEELRRETGIPKETLELLIKKAGIILQGDV
jgi:hypothetical protein